MAAIFKRELKAYFKSPIGYIFIGLCILVAAVFFWIGNLAYGLANMGTFFSNVGVVYIIVIPILTMRSMAEERKSRTDQLLMTAPVRTSDIVIGKFLAAVAVLTITCVVMLLFPFILRLYGEIALGEIVIGFLGLYLMGVMFISIGILMSTLTVNQVIAAVSTGAVLLLLWFMESIAGQVSSSMATTGALAVIGQIAASILNFFAVTARFADFTQGIFNLVPIFYFLSLAFLFVFLSIRVVERRRWR